MADYTGSFQYLAPDGSVAQQGDCRVQFDAETLTLAPQSAPPIALDLGDLDGVIAENHQLRLPLYTGRTLLLRQLGRAYERLAHDLLEAYRDRIVQCLLLEDLEELARFPGAIEAGLLGRPCPSCGAAPHATTKFCPECGTALHPQPAGATQSGAAELRLYKSNLAVLPESGAAFQWRLAEVDAVRFQPGDREVVLESSGRYLRVLQLARRTEDFATRLRDVVGALTAQSAQALHQVLPFLDPDQFQRVAGLWREGGTAPLAKLTAVHPRIATALAANAVDKDLKPYYDELLRRTAANLLYVGFKMIRPEDKIEEEPEEPSTAEAAAEAPQAEAAAEPEAAPVDPDAPETLYWFFFPMAKKPGSAEPANIVAWEASSRGGRATYFFRLVDPAQATALADGTQAAALVEAAVQRLNRVLALVNFRRRPIYLSDEQLEINPQYHRYAIAARRIAELRQVRAGFLGRAIHSSPAAWRAQVDAVLVRYR